MVHIKCYANLLRKSNCEVWIGLPVRFAESNSQFFVHINFLVINFDGACGGYLFHQDFSFSFKFSVR